ncbi:PLP-dependent aminotransferase family protein [Nocardioides sp. TRM66260-LWL]|uniref:MocR-like transcription factor YczR n=1 Tax=Nocardioides sp. TRM66260-LWL TaxID=2874478 RepID=UPI001CC66AB2|nr:PLP-dependent aminotransferase family protein [Nocardioides sp. TRM66260-LWL]MBZ5733094.1 PLP-dependent aminotransferase family protein [Nocardioides sp. TRM66260-LWL]
MSQTTDRAVVPASRLAALVAGFDTAPAYAGLAEALTEAIGDGRIGRDARLPSERDLTAALGVSRTTVTRAYALLRETGYAEARQGSGTFTRLPGSAGRSRDRTLMPHPDEGLIDLTCAAATAPPGLLATVAEAVGDLPACLGDHGYFPAGLPALQAAIAAGFAERGLPTDPEQIIVTPGALSAAAIVARALTRRGARFLVESPVYPNATEAIRHAGARLVASPVDPEGWDLPALGATLQQVRPALAYLIPDFQNPTGHLMDDADRAELAHRLATAGTRAVVDESHQALALDGQPMPLPFAAHAPGTVTLGSASKSFWGGLRLGWIRAPHDLLPALTDARLSLDLGAPVLEQLVLTRLLERGQVFPDHVARLREQRDALLGALAERLPEARFVPPGGGLAVWCRLPAARATALAAEAERRGVAIAPGPLFAVDGGLDRFVRIPWSRPADELVLAVDRLAAAWEVVGRSSGPEPRRRGRAAGSGRVLVA